MLGENYSIGDVVEVLDQIDCETTNTATIKLIEIDNEIKGLFWLYLLSDDEKLNIQFDPRIGQYWRLIANAEPYVKLISKATL